MTCPNLEDFTLLLPLIAYFHQKWSILIYSALKIRRETGKTFIPIFLINYETTKTMAMANNLYKNRKGSIFYKENSFYSESRQTC